jgi:hemerythrin
MILTIQLEGVAKNAPLSRAVLFSPFMTAHSGYSEYDEHKEQHDLLAEKAKQLMYDFTRGQGSRAMEVMLFLSNWLNVHILEVDKRYASFLNNKVVS